MLQLSVAGTRDYELRIPTRIRSIVINNAAGTDDGQISVRSPFYSNIPNSIMSRQQANLRAAAGAAAHHCRQHLKLVTTIAIGHVRNINSDPGRMNTLTPSSCQSIMLKFLELFL